MRRTRWLLLGSFALVAAACSDAPSSTTAAQGSAAPVSTVTTPVTDPIECSSSGADERSDIYRVVPDSDPDLTSLDVVAPVRPEACGPSPVMIWVHGGGWRFGDRRNQVADKTSYFTRAGWTFVPVNYRLSPAVQYPVHNDDVAAAIGWVLDHATELGVDPDRVSLMGHSAGAAIVAGVITDPDHLAAVGRAPSDVRCAVMLDTNGYDVAAEVAEGNRIYVQAFGTDPSVLAAASPLNNVSTAAGVPRSLLVTRGSAPRRATTDAFGAALSDAGVEVRIVDPRPLNHMEVNRAIGSPDDELVTPVLTEFLEGC